MITNKKKLIIVGAGIALYLLFKGCVLTAYTQEGTTDEQSGKISNQPNISDKINKTEQSEISDKIEDNDKIEEIKQSDYFKELGDKINESFQKTLANYTEIGGKPAYEKTIDGKEYCFLENTGNLNENLKGLLDCALLAYVPKGKNLGHMSIINEAITEGFKEVLSPFSYTPMEMEFLRYLRGENGCAYLKTNIKDTKSSTQNKGE